MRALRGLWWIFGFSTPVKAISPAQEDKSGSPKERQCRTVRKRLHRVTRLLLAILPRRIQSALGYPVCISIGCAVSPGMIIPFLQVNSILREKMQQVGVCFRSRGALFSCQALWQRQQEKTGWPGWGRGGWAAVLGGGAQSGSGWGRPCSWSGLWGLLYLPKSRWYAPLVSANFSMLFSCSPADLRQTVRNTGRTMTLRVTWK